MYYTYTITGLIFIISLIANREKTLKAVKIAITKFIKIFPAFLTMLIFVSFILFIFPDEVILNYLGHSSKSISVFMASLFGSITIMPGFIAFPLSGILLNKGVPYMVLSAFTTTLMMVGILTYPVEKEYFGVKVTIIRNIISLFIALAVAMMTGIFFGEIF
jgi:uncharacterized membrane protein YraQ (UPF0718 family)